MLKLLGRSNAYNVRKVLWPLGELGLPFEHEAWGRGHRPTSEPEFLALNPLGGVPVLVDGPVVLRESHVILALSRRGSGHASAAGGAGGAGAGRAMDGLGRL